MSTTNQRRQQIVFLHSNMWSGPKQLRWSTLKKAPGTVGTAHFLGMVCFSHSQTRAHRSLGNAPLKYMTQGSGNSVTPSGLLLQSSP